jgi:ATP synthase protein I
MPLDNNPDPNSPPIQKRAQGFSQSYATAVELPLVLVGCILIAGGLGYLLDGWLHTKPLLMIILGVLGFAAGVREILRRLPTS